MSEAIEKALAEFKAALDAFRNSKKTPEQIEKAKELYDSLDPCDRSLLEYIFPELAESEDERILQMLENTLRDALIHECVSEMSFVEMSSYLDRLKEQKDYRKRYEDIAKSEWFKKAYKGKSLGCDYEQKDQKPFSQEVFDAAKHEALWGEQKPTGWSEEDEKILDELLDHCNTENATWYNWLKSLRSRLKSSGIWNPSEEQPEVELEKEIIRYQREDMDRDTTVRDVARHFFELGLNARKEERICQDRKDQ